MTEAELLTCPFCGRAQRELDRENIEIRKMASRDEYIIMCRCGINSGEYCHRETAIDHWNTRATPPDQIAKMTPKEREEIVDLMITAHLGLSQSDLNAAGGKYSFYVTEGCRRSLEVIERDYVLVKKEKKCQGQ